MDGSEDDMLMADVVDFWHKLQMPSARQKIKDEVRRAVASSQVQKFEDYAKLLEP